MEGAERKLDRDQESSADANVVGTVDCMSVRRKEGREVGDWGGGVPVAGALGGALQRAESWFAERKVRTSNWQLWLQLCEYT